jgi:hypothetical protein
MENPYSVPSLSPANTRPPAVAVAPPIIGAGRRLSRSTRPLPTSTAVNVPLGSSGPGDTDPEVGLTLTVTGCVPGVTVDDGAVIDARDVRRMRVRTVGHRYGILLLADEVISGFGRVGECFACDRYGARPDLTTLAKGLTSAYAPMGAVLVGERVSEVLCRPDITLAHGITFGGHPLSAAIALRNLEIFERDEVLENVRALEPRLRARLAELRALPAVGDVRGDGFFWAIELVGADQRPLDAWAREDMVRLPSDAAARAGPDRPRRRPRRRRRADRAAADL